MTTRRFRRAAVFAAALVIAGCSSDPQQQAREYIASGDDYASKGSRDEAIIQYRNAIKVQPISAEAHYKLGLVYEASGDPVSAYREYARAGDLEPSHADAQLKAGTLLLVAREFDAARTRAELAVKADPKSAAAHILLGNAHAGLNEMGSALRQIEQAIALDPAYAPAWSALGAVQYLGGRRDAEQAFRKAVELAPSSLDARLGLANYQWASGNVQEAEQTLRAALAIDPRSASAHRALALLYVTTKRAPEAEPHFKALTAEKGGKLALADYYLGTARTADALAVIGDVERSGDAEEVRSARLRRATVAYGAGRKEEAHGIMDALLKERPRYTEARIAKARMQLADGAISDAVETARAAVRTDATLPGAQYTLGLALMALGKPEEAEAAFVEVTRISPRAAAAQMHLARLRLARGEALTALDAAREASRQRPDSPEAAVLVSRSLRAQGKAAQASLELSRRLERDPGSAALQIEMGWVRLEGRDHAGARRAFNAALEIEPQAFDARSGIVATDIAEGKTDAARAAVDEWRRTTPGDSRLTLLAAKVELAASRLPDAERLLAGLVASDPSQLEAYELLAQVYVSQNRLDRAIEQYQALAKHSRSPAGPRTMAGLLQEARGDRISAKATYEAVLAQEPRAGVAANNLAWIYIEEGRLDDALRLARVAQEELRRRPEGEDTLGWVQLRKGMATSAVAAFSRAVDRAPDKPVYHYHLGLAYLQSGDARRGRESLRRALELSATFPGADDARKRLGA